MTPTVADYLERFAHAFLLDELCDGCPCIVDNDLDDYAAAHPGFVIVNLTLIEALPMAVRLWVLQHERAHVLNGPDELAADRFAIAHGLDEGWLDQDGLDEVCAFIATAPGSAAHPPGPERARLMREAFSAYASQACPQHRGSRAP